MIEMWYVLSLEFIIDIIFFSLTQAYYKKNNNKK